MKLWQKIFIGVLIIFLIVFDVGAYFLTFFAYNYNRESEIQTGVNEQSIILSSLSVALLRAEEFNPDILSDNTHLQTIVKTLADYYSSQNVQLALLSNDKIIYSNIPQIDEEVLNLSDAHTKNIKDTVVDEKRILFVASKTAAYPELTFVYARDISSIDLFLNNISKFFVIINIAVLLLMSFLLWLLLKRMTRPISQLNQMTAEISDGSYNKRITVNSNDELGELAKSFNRMADSVEDTMRELKNAADEKQQFINDLAHEIKTPITSVIGYADYLKTANSSEESKLLALDHIHTAMIRLQNLSTELLKLTLLQNETADLSKVNIPALFSELKNTMAPAFEKRGIKLITETKIDFIIADETLLYSMLTNLIENAARASSDSSRVILRAYREKNSVIEVIDEGFGIKEDEIKKITAPFYRADKSRSRQFGGVGLGLSIVSRIVALHNAELKIISKENHGTKIKVIFTT